MTYGLPQITSGNYTFDAMNRFVYLGSAITCEIDVRLVIKRRINLINKYYFGLSMQLRRRVLLGSTKLMLCKPLIRKVLLHGAESWILLRSYALVLEVFGRKILRKMR